jgi:hydroxymethylglutaryl-CoA lyase
MRHPASVTIVEVGPRDGLQNEATPLSAADKVSFVDRLTAAGLPAIEVAAFVSPKWVPQMADAAEVCARIERYPGVRYSALVPNLHGLERAHDAGITEVGIFAAASEGFSRKNINQGVEESLDSYRAVCARAAELGLRVRGYVSTAFGCPFDGAVAPAKVADVAAALVNMGAFEVAVSDTIGVAHPRQVAEVVSEVAGQIPLAQIALHFHDTRGMALANVMAGLDSGVRTYDASCGGLGGCPYAPGATGNLATEDLVYLLDGLGVDTGVDLSKLLDASAFIEGRIGHALPGRVYRASRGGLRASESPKP